MGGVELATVLLHDRAQLDLEGDASLRHLSECGGDVVDLERDLGRRLVGGLVGVGVEVQATGF
jgi:hypothetical protein